LPSGSSAHIRTARINPIHTLLSNRFPAVQYKKILAYGIGEKTALILRRRQEAPLFKVLGKKKEYAEGTGKAFPFAEGEKDSWANLLEHNGSEKNVRLKLAIDKIGAGLLGYPHRFQIYACKINHQQGLIVVQIPRDKARERIGNDFLPQAEFL